MVLGFAEFDLLLLAHNYSSFSRSIFKSCFDWSLAALFGADVPTGPRTGRFLAGPLLHNSGYLPGEISDLSKLLDHIRSQTETHHIFPLRQLKLSENALRSRFR